MVNHCLKEIFEIFHIKIVGMLVNLMKMVYNVLFVKFAKVEQFIKSVVFNPQTHQDLYNKLEIKITTIKRTR